MYVVDRIRYMVMAIVHIGDRTRSYAFLAVEIYYLKRWHFHEMFDASFSLEIFSPGH